MKTMRYIALSSLLLAAALLPVSLFAAEGDQIGWGAPIMPGGKVVKTESGIVYIEYDKPYNEVLAWYREAMKSHVDKETKVEYAKFRDWEDQMYIEDQGAAKWHSVSISKGTGPKTTLKIVKDNWTWVMSTLLIRYAGVFCVLIILWILLNINSAVMKRVFAKQKDGAKVKTA